MRHGAFVAAIVLAILLAAPASAQFNGGNLLGEFWKRVFVFE